MSKPQDAARETARASALSQSIGACLAYGGASLFIILINKAILSRYGFAAPVFMALVHMGCCLFFLTILKRLAFIDFADFSMEYLRRFLPIATMFILNIVVGLMAVKYVNVPMFTTLRRLTALITLVLEYLRTLETPSLRIVLPVLGMISGAMIAGSGDLAYDPYGYAAAMINNFLTAGYLVVSKKLLSKVETAEKDAEKLNKFGVLFYNALVSVPLLVVICAATDEMDRVRNFEYLYNPMFQLVFLISALLAFAINWVTLWCTEVNSPLTTSVTGQTKNILVTIFGSIMFGDVHPTLLLVAGVSCSLCSSFVFAYQKFQLQKRETVIRYQEEKDQTTTTDDLEAQPLLNGCPHEEDQEEIKLP